MQHATFLTLLFILMIHGKGLVADAQQSVNIDDCVVLSRWPNFVAYALSQGEDYRICFPFLPKCNNAGVVCDANGRVVYLGLLGDGLRGPLPNVISELSQLHTLMLSQNDLSGTLPASWGDLTQLTYLSFSRNGRIHGTIPSTWSKLTKLESIAMSYNKLSGTLPKYFGNFKQLTGFYAVENRFTGTLPPEWSGMTSMGYV